MSNTVPKSIKIYHIVHIDNLRSIINGAGIIPQGAIFSDSIMQKFGIVNKTIGLNQIKKRRLEELTLSSYPDLHVGDCVPFYFCPRSVMLYMIHRADYSKLHYKDGQNSIIHLVADFKKARKVLKKAKLENVFTTSNAGAEGFRDYTKTVDLKRIDWDAVNANRWTNCKESKQAEFLVKYGFPWLLIEKIGVYSRKEYNLVKKILKDSPHKPEVEIKTDWYY